MLFDKKRADRILDIRSIESVIAWLERKPPRGRYHFMDCAGACLFDRYLTEHGINDEEAREEIYEHLHDRYRSLASAHPGTFGAALKRFRARALAE